MADEDERCAPAAPAKARGRRGKAGHVVICNLPDALPVTEGELDMLERELGPFIAALLRR
jgi:hypothetical protein